MPKDKTYNATNPAGAAKGSNYEPGSAPVSKHGGNQAIHDGIETNETPQKASAPIEMPTSG